MSPRTVLALLLSLAVPLAGAGCKKKKAHDPAAYQASYRVEPSSWTGKLTIPARGGPQTFPFELVIEHVSADGKVDGYMDWGPELRTAVSGSAEGNHLELVDTAFLKGSSGKLGEKKDLYIRGDSLGGTDKDGAAFIIGTRAP